jgi:hypothetical protein
MTQTNNMMMCMCMCDWYEIHSSSFVRVHRSSLN